MKTHTQKGSAHAVIIGILTVVIIGLLGVLFWQNVINKPQSETQNSTARANDDSKPTEKTPPSSSPLPTADVVAEAKVAISEAMNKPQYQGLAQHMAATVDRAISHSDGIFNDEPGVKSATEIYRYYEDYAKWNNDALPNSWTFKEAASIDDVSFKKQVAGAPSYYQDTFVGIGKGGRDDAFVAFRLNDQGEITYAFHGYIVGY